MRLRLEGEGRHWSLQRGETVLGSAPGGGILLAARGVSRRHAVIETDDAGARIRDLGSKNGTRVNGSAVSTSPLRPGDEIELGAARLRLAEVDADDVELAISLPDLPSLPTADASAPTSLVGRPGARSAADQLALVSRFFLAVGAVDGPCLEAALACLADAPERPGAFVVRRVASGPPVLVAARGAIESVAAQVTEAWSRLTDEAGLQVLTVEPAAPGPRGVGVVARGAGDELGLFLLVRRADDADLPLLATLVPMLARFVTPSTATRSGPSGALPLPSEIVPTVVPAMQAVYEQIVQIGDHDTPVLILGESGAGKEHLARLVHDSSPRASGPFVAVNCAAVPQELLEAEMFGIGRGVATGVAARVGTFQQADGGTLFLDEIGDMPPTLQAKLLRALEGGAVVPVGREAVAVDVRVVAATHADLDQRMADGSFRSDLYFRLAGYVLDVPPLRARRADLPALVTSFVRRHAVAAGKSVRGITVKALEALRAHAWPGNVRELDHLLRRAVAACADGEAIDAALLPSRLREGRGTPVPFELGVTSLPAHLEAEERRLLRLALDSAGGNQTRAAKLLGVSRNGLAYRLKRLGLRVDR